MTPNAVTIEQKPWLASYPSFADWGMDIRTEPAHAAFERSVAAYPNRTCMEFLGRTWTYRQTGIMVRAAAKGLQDMGVQKGNRVALMLPNTPYYIVLFHAVLLIGGVVVNINPLYAQQELDVLAKDSRPRMLVTMDLELTYPKARKTVDRNKIEKLLLCSMIDVLPWRKAVLFNIFKRKTLAQIEDNKRQVWFENLVQNEGNYRSAAIDPENDVAVLQYTGGTTGTPKAAMLTHANVRFGGNASAKGHVATSRFRGVCWVKRDKKWRVQITIEGKQKLLGYFNNEKDAARKYDEQATLLSKPVNFPKHEGQKQAVKMATRWGPR